MQLKKPALPIATISQKLHSKGNDPHLMGSLSGFSTGSRTGCLSSFIFPGPSPTVATVALAVALAGGTVAMADVLPVAVAAAGADDEEDDDDEADEDDSDFKALFAILGGKKG